MQKTTARTGAGGAQSRTSGERLRALFGQPEFILFLVIILLIVLGGIVNPRSLGIENLKIMTRDTAILAIAAIGVSFTILTGGIDLSVGSIIGLAGVMSAYFMINWVCPSGSASS